MYGIFTNIYPINEPNVGKYTIHGASGYECKPFISISEAIPKHLKRLAGSICAGGSFRQGWCRKKLSVLTKLRKTAVVYMGSCP
jgi:hypothetical protein